MELRSRVTGATTAGSTSGKCKECRDKRRLRCITPPGATKCERCRDLGLMCITPLTEASLEDEDLVLTPGECSREIARPTTLQRTRIAIMQVLEALGRRWGGEGFPEQLLSGARMLMSRAQASNDIALLHAAVSLCASIRLEGSMSTFGGDAKVVDPDHIEALVAEADEYVQRKRDEDSVPSKGIAVARHVVRAGVASVWCNELFKSTFFDVANKDIRALYYDLSVALVDDESKEALRALDDKVVEASIFEEVPPTPLGLFVVAATSDKPLTLVGGTGERLRGTLRWDSVWSAESSVHINNVVVFGLEDRYPRQEEAALAHQTCSPGTEAPLTRASSLAADSSIGLDDDGLITYDEDARWFSGNLFD